MKESPSLCIFSNFFIDNSERLQRLKDSFESFKKIHPSQWIINIRGNYKKEAAEFLRQNIDEKLNLSHIESSKGWLYDTNLLSQQITSDYVFLWVEDHILIKEIIHFENIIKEMFLNEVDSLEYTWFHKKTKDFFYSIPTIKKGEYIDISFLNERKKSLLRKSLKFKNWYIVSLTSIMKNSYLKKILNTNRPFFKRWEKRYPFDFEKKIIDCKGLNMKIARPKYELFASIDDDHGVDSYSLISRGKYPNRISRKDLQVIEYKQSKLKLAIKKITPKIILSIFEKIFKFFRRITYTLSYIL